MKKVFLRAFAAMTAIIVALSQASAFASVNGFYSNRLSDGKGEAIVMFKPGSKTALSMSGVSVEKSLVFDSKRKVALVTSDKYSTDSLIKLLKRQSNVLVVEPNKKLKAMDVENYESYQWAIDNNGQQNGTEDMDIGVKTLWDEGVRSGDKVVAILDTGVDLDHEDLKDNLWVNPYPRELSGKHGYDFINYDADPDDDNGHGTHCAGIITAKANEKGVSGVNSDVKLMVLKFLDFDGYGDSYEALEAYNYIYRAQQLGVKVVAINNSWGGSEDGSGAILKSIVDLVGEKGAISVFAAGNNGQDMDDNDSHIYSMDIDSKYVVKVAATTEKGTLAEFSNYGKNTVDTAAPGTDILSTVSYASYNPGIYNQTKRESVSYYYTDFEDENNFPDHSESPLGVKTMKLSGAEGESSYQVQSEEYFGQKTSNSKALEWKIEDTEGKEIHTLYIPYEALSVTNYNKQSYVSLMLKVKGPKVTSEEDESFITVTEKNVNDVDAESDDMLDFIKVTDQYYEYIDGNSDSWSHVLLEASGIVKAGDARAIELKCYCTLPGDYTIYIDDVGVSKSYSVSQAEEQFGKYDFLSGTSMAAPFVTGAIALAAKYYSSYDILKVKNAVIGSARVSDALIDKTKSGGTLDLRKIKNPNPVISSVSEKSSVVTLSGNFFGTAKGSVYVNDNLLTASKVTSWKDTEIKVNVGDYAKKRVTLKIVTPSGASAKTELFVNGNSSAYKSLGKLSIGVYDATISTDGSNFYIFDYYEESFLKGYIKDGKVKYKSLRFPNPKNFFPKEVASDAEYFYFSSDLVFLNGKLWGVAKLNNYYACYYSLVSYNLSTNKWQKESDLPADSESMKYGDSSLGVYNGKLYLIGGFNPVDETASKLVRIYNTSTKKWSNGPDLPSGRYKSKAIQVGSKLVVIYGGDSSQNMPKTAVFDGKTWTEKSVPPIPENGYCEYLDYSYDEDYWWYGYSTSPQIGRYYTANVGLTKDGLIISSANCDGLGDTFKYTLSTDKFTTLPYSYSSSESKFKKVKAIAVGNKFISFVDIGKTFLDDEDYYYINSGYNAYFDEDYMSLGKCNVSYISITSGNYKVTRKITGDGEISGNSSYLPGDYVTLTASPSKNYFFKSLYVDGKKVKGKKYSYVVTKDITVKANFGAYVSKIKLNKTKDTLKAGKKIKLKATVYPSKAENKKIKWYSSNNKYATVNSKGVVTTKKAGIGKTVKIYAAAMDRNKKVKAYCTIKITE